MLGAYAQYSPVSHLEPSLVRGGTRGCACRPWDIARARLNPVTAEPLDDGGYDPTEILRALPEAWHERFLGEYHTALDAAHEVWRFHQLRDLLHTWRLRAAAFADPGF